jgi:hypothetical protein
MTRVSAMRLTDGPTESDFLSRNDDQMHMIGHQTIAPYLNPFFSAPVGYQIEIFPIILVPEKYLLPTVPSLGDVMRDPRYHNSCQSRHGCSIASIDIVSPY